MKKKLTLLGILLIIIGWSWSLKITISNFSIMKIKIFMDQPIECISAAFTIIIGILLIVYINKK